MKLFNTLTHQADEFTPSSDSDRVTMYSCGPTVYDRAHIGNLASYIYVDLLKRALGVAGWQLHHVMNLTDIEDKIIARSRERYPDESPMAALKTLTHEFGESFFADMKRLGNDVGDTEFVRATDSIDGMQQLIAKLHGCGVAYIADDGVYFSLKSYLDHGGRYGQLSDVSADTTSRARIANDEYDKQSVHDFALWKKQKEGEPSWPFELDGHDLNGRPGWHIECSAMSTSRLGQPFDIHTGGVDLIFPHHENEIAQSTACEPDQAYARFFIHTEHLMVEGQKMSKSLKNYYTLDDIASRVKDPLAFRLLILQSHYQSHANFSWDILTAAEQRLISLRAMADLRFQLRDQGNQHDFDQPLKAMKAALLNNLDTPVVFAELSRLQAAVETAPPGRAQKNEFEALLAWLDQALGLGLLASQDITEQQKQQIADREAARKADDFAKADGLRQDLAEGGLTINDTEHGPVWQRS